MITVQQHFRHLKPLIRIGQKYQYLADTPDAYNPAKDGYPRHQGDGNYRGNGYYGGDKDYYGSGNNREDGGHPAHGDWHENSLENTDGQEGSSAAYGRRSALYGKDGKRDTTLYPIKLHPGQTIELNRADTTALKRIPGIGSYYARKIVQHRDKLGGFVSIAQLEELENLPMGILSNFSKHLSNYYIVSWIVIELEVCTMKLTGIHADFPANILSGALLVIATTALTHLGVKLYLKYGKAKLEPIFTSRAYMIAVFAITIAFDLFIINYIEQCGK